jgi:hypothetical protein
MGVVRSVPARPRAGSVWDWIVIAAVLLLCAGLVIIVWRAGLLDVDAERSDAEVVAAVLSLAGGLVAASLTFVGVLLKHSLDTRNLRLAQETEARLKLETSISAVELLTVEGGNEAPPQRQAGALFVLASLGQLDFALALLSECWPARSISVHAANWVVDKALRSDDPRLQVTGAEVLLANAGAIAETPGQFELPQCASLDWPSSAHYFARGYTLQAILTAIAARPLGEWDDGLLNFFVVQLNQVRVLDPHPELQAGAIVALDIILESEKYEHPFFDLYLPDGNLNVATLKVEIASLVPEARVRTSSAVTDLAERLRPTPEATTAEDG